MLNRTLTAAMLCGAALAQGDVPEFVAGDLADLACAVIDVGGQTGHSCWLVVEVRNRGAAAAEPLAFRIVLPPVKRGELPRVETFRPTGAGERCPALLDRDVTRGQAPAVRRGCQRGVLASE